MSNAATPNSPSTTHPSVPDPADADLAPAIDHDRSTERVLAVDCGQSGSRATIVRHDQVVVERFDLPPVRTDHDVLPQLVDLVRGVCRDHEADAVALGVSGLTDADTADSLLDELRGQTPIRRVVLAHDSVSSYLGALGAEAGVVTAAGTGVVTLAVGAERSVRVDGWGNIMGDAGSGYWIGRAGLDAGMRAFDGRTDFGRASEAMLQVIRDDFGDPADAYMQLQADSGRVQRVASYARVVLDLAAGGDAACLQIADDAALELAVSASTGLRLVGETEDSQCALLGGIFASRLVREAFERHLHELADGVRLVESRGTGLDGAVLLANLAADHPLRQKFTEAGD